MRMILPRPDVTYDPIDTFYSNEGVTTSCQIDQSCTLRYCRDCGEFIPHDDPEYDYNNEPICEDCFNNLYCTCSQCQEVLLSDDATIVDGDLFCPDCTDAHLTTCDRCGDWVIADDSVAVHNGQVCEDCSAYYSTCDDCGVIWNNDEINYCEQCEHHYCPECTCACANTPDNDHQFRFVTSTKPGEIVQSMRYVGFEIECESGDAQELGKLSNDCSIETDGSLDSDGREIVTNPASGQELEELTKTTTNIIKSAGYNADSSHCGLHTHVDARDFLKSPGKIARLFRTVYAFEPLLFKILPRRRRDNRYAKSIRRHFKVTDLKLNKKMADIERGWYKRGAVDKSSKWDDTRYFGLNLHSLYHRGSVEFRYHEGSLSSVDMLQWANIVTRIVDYAYSGYKNADIKQVMTLDADQLLEPFCKLLNVSEQTKKYMLWRTELFK